VVRVNLRNAEELLPKLPLGDEPRIGRAGLVRAVDRLRASTCTADVITGPLVPLSEALQWIHACHEWLRNHGPDPASYTAISQNWDDAEARTVDGVLCARGRLAHQLALGGVVLCVGAAGTYAAGLYAAGMGGVEWRWRPTLPPDNRPGVRDSNWNRRREAHYADHVARRPLLDPVDDAAAVLLRHLPT